MTHPPCVVIILESFFFCIASEHGFVNIVEFLLAHNADINAKDYKGRTAFLKAVRLGENEVVELLLKNNAEVNARNNWHLMNDAIAEGECYY